MSERPILFSGPMVRAILDGRKTQTRRVLKDNGRPFPYEVGNRLWVRETHATVPSTAYRMSDGVEQIVNPSDPDMAAIYACGWERCAPRWRPSIHMPRWASRITLTVTDVRVQRVQEISGADALAEGIADFPRCGCEVCARSADMCPADASEACMAFAHIWDGINAKRGYGWNANPWVIALTFRVHTKSQDMAGTCESSTKQNVSVSAAVL